MPNESIEAVGNDGIRLRLEFRWLGDRYGHLIARIKSEGNSEPLFESIEGALSDTWPPSPPLQTLSIEKMANGHPAALLVGMAGRSHWSASIEPVPDRAELIFDIACRHSDKPRYLGSQYRTLAAPENVIAIRGLDSEIEQQAEGWLIRPGSTSTNTPTTRWKYAISLRSNQY
jgi:hypothetical protein